MAHALIFDSGVGGLSVVKEIRQRCPDLHLSYVADEEFRPYGEKTEQALRARLPRLLSELCIMLDPDLIVMACNTASTTALAQIRAAVPVPVIGVVPAIKPAAAGSRTKTIGVLGTPGTVKREYVDRLIENFASDCRVILQGSVNLVDEAEAKLSGRAVNMDAIKRELAPMFTSPNGMHIDAVVLACTHFPLLREELKASVTQTVQWIDSGAAIARRTEVVLANLAQKGCLKPAPSRNETAFLIGPHPRGDRDQARRSAFVSYGFENVIGLLAPK